MNEDGRPRSGVPNASKRDFAARRAGPGLGRRPDEIDLAAAQRTALSLTTAQRHRLIRTDRLIDGRTAITDKDQVRDRLRELGISVPHDDVYDLCTPFGEAVRRIFIDHPHLP